MKVLKIVFALAALGSMHRLHAQELVTTLSADKGGDTIRKGNKIVLIERYPHFSGSLRVWLRSNISYGKQRGKARCNGKAEIGFIIDEQGGVDSVHIKKASGLPWLDEEGLRVVRLMSQGRHWTPGTQNGKPVRVKMSIPFVCRMD